MKSLFLTAILFSISQSVCAENDTCTIQLKYYIEALETASSSAHSSEKKKIATLIKKLNELKKVKTDCEILDFVFELKTQ